MTSDEPRRGPVSRTSEPRAIRVLILEDVPIDAELMLHELTRAGFQVEWSRVDTERGYLAALHPRLDVVLADYRLPQFDALTALEHLKESGWDVPFIIVSGAISEEAAVESMKQGAADYVLKDRMARLGQAVARALEDRDRRAARERAERELRESEEKFRLLVEGARDFAIVMLDPDGLVTHWNAGAERIHGWRAGEILGQPLARFFVPDEVAHGVPESALELAATAGRYEAQGRRMRRDGSTFWADTVITGLHHPSGELRGFAAVTRDISEQRRAAEALARQSEELARSNAELEVFAHVASHDLKEPLRMIARYTKMLAQKAHGQLGPEADEWLVYTQDGVTRMQTLIDDVLAYSRSHQGGNVFVTTDAGRVLQSALANLHASIAETSARVTHDPLPLVTADETQLTQVFQNLIGNALKHRGAEPPRVHVSAAPENGMWRFRVSDNGSGIDPEHRGRVFRLFERLHDRPDVPGSGIGLAICKRIVERHGGTIDFDSTPGAGTTFHFTLPAAPHDA
jgi:PAS domain S-box-containing protein